MRRQGKDPNVRMSAQVRRPGQSQKDEDQHARTCVVCSTPRLVEIERRAHDLLTAGYADEGIVRQQVLRAAEVAQHPITPSEVQMVAYHLASGK